MNERYEIKSAATFRSISRLFNFPPLFRKQVKEGLDVSEVADYMRGLGFHPSDYQIECLHHELQIQGKRKVPFEDLVKLYVNHSPFNSENFSVEKSLKMLLDSPTNTSHDIIISKSQIISILTESAEKIDEKDAKLYLKELFSNGSGNFVEEIPLSEFLLAVQNCSSINSFCITQSCK